MKIQKRNTTNNKARFIVLTTVMGLVFPLTLLLVFVAWLGGHLEDLKDEYVTFGRESFAEDVQEEASGS